MSKMALVGRPNVGKSALFNRICNKRIAIVDEAEGITRDRIYARAEAFGAAFDVIDTGGIDPRSEDPFQEKIRLQTEIAICEADTIVMVVDGQVGPHELDHFLAQLLLKSQKPITLAVNKMDNLEKKDLFYPFYALGISKIIPVSALHGFQIAELIELAWEGIECCSAAPLLDEIKVAVVGRANVGKSTLINQLLEEERCLVSPIAGTTRDSLDISFSLKGKNYTLIDTAGIRRKKSEHEAVEKFAALRTQRSIERCDFCLLIIDVQEGVTTQDKKIAREIAQAGKGCVFLLNKWDLVKGFRMEHAIQAIKTECPFLAHSPILLISAKEGRNLEKIFPEIETLVTASEIKISTPQLNQFIERAIQRNHPPMLTGKCLKIYYMTQTASHPPRFILFVNNPRLMDETYKKYLINQFRSHFPWLRGLPIEFTLRGKTKKSLNKVLK